jgi:hypothetical protein
LEGSDFFEENPNTKRGEYYTLGSFPHRHFQYKRSQQSKGPISPPVVRKYLENHLEFEPLAKGFHFSLASCPKVDFNLGQFEKKGIYWTLIFPTLHATRIHGESLELVSLKR